MESGCLVVGNYQLVRPGAVRLETQYRVPNIVDSTLPSRRIYRLRFHKQPGRDRDTLTVRVTVPDGARVTRSSPGGMTRGRTVTFATTTELDRDFEVEFAPG
jgi:hypothetical protein